MKNKSLLCSLLAISLMISHVPCFAVSPLNEQTILPLESAPILAVGAAALPVVAPIIAAQSPITAMAGFAGYILFHMILNYIAPLPKGPSLVPPRNNREKIIKPGETIQPRSRYALTNKTDKPIIYDTQSGKISEANYSEEGASIKGKEREVETKFKS